MARRFPLRFRLALFLLSQKTSAIETPARQTPELSRHSKRSIKILNSQGSPYTNRRSAQRLVDRDKAEWIDERSILLRAPRDRAPADLAAPAARPHTPTFRVVRRHVPLSEPQGFNRYPVDEAETLKRWKRQKKQAA